MSDSNFSTLENAYAWLDSHVNYEAKLDHITYDAKTFELEEFRGRLGRLGDPHLSGGSIHIAGTRGKGTAALFLERLLMAHGLSVATFTSPHLREYRERIRISGAPISPEQFIRMLEKLRCHDETQPGAESQATPTSVPPARGPEASFKTVFEHLTAMFFLAAREAKVDWRVVETGLGGRLDATNVLGPGPVLLTRIGLEHTHLLGSTYEAIAGEKAAILKAGGWGVAGRQD
ncbi:hypothetical protein HY256_12390, partial [Candidatus Sumerlaeota bacterium]|nr:hypothetical protein [Candidatus Sumerlaeota bacterium]